MKRTTISSKKATPYEILFERAQHIAIIDLVYKQINKELRDALHNGEAFAPETIALREHAHAVNVLLSSLEAAQLAYMEEHPETVKKYKSTYLAPLLAVYEQEKKEAHGIQMVHESNVVELDTSSHA